MMRRLVIGVFIAILASASPARSSVDVTPDPREPLIFLDGDQEQPGSSSPAPGPAAPNAPVEAPWTPILSCRVDEVTGVYGCRADEPEPETDDEDGPALTEGDVLRAARTIGLPSLAVQIQPGDETLVNVPTIFYTEPQPFARSVDLLGFDVDLTATPVQYVWNHGDGTATSTSTPGKPYPAMDVTHRYRKPAKNVRPRVDVTYRVRFRVDGGAWQTIGQTLLASGPAAQLRVSEAAPVLTKP